MGQCPFFGAKKFIGQFSQFDLKTALVQKIFRLGLGLQKGTVSLFGAKNFYWPIKLILTSKRHWWKKMLDWGWSCEKGQCPFLRKKNIIGQFS